jgi:hypothetical protein
MAIDARAVQSLSQHIAQLIQGERTQNWDAAWASVRDSLNWLYAIEETAFERPSSRTDSGPEDDPWRV